jgi:hypothetical protein
MGEAAVQQDETRDGHAPRAIDPRFVLVPHDDLERTIGVKLRLNRLRVLWKAGEFPVPKQISAHRIAWLLADLLEWVAARPPAKSVSSLPEPVAAAPVKNDPPTEPAPSASAKPRRRVGTRRRR